MLSDSRRDEIKDLVMILESLADEMHSEMKTNIRDTFIILAWEYKNQLKIDYRLRQAEEIKMAGNWVRE